MASRSPVAFFSFNRPELTRQALQPIIEYNPSLLFLIADGPRTEHPDDVHKCEAVRSILNSCSIKGDVVKIFADNNLGLKQRFRTGLDRVFNEVEAVTILEDDCVANKHFLPFCEELLSKYANEERIWGVTGNNFQDGAIRGDASYYFSRYLHIWGWATWRRVWRSYDTDLAQWPSWKQTAVWREVFCNADERSYWESVFDCTHAGKVDTWDYQLTASALFHGGLVVTPQHNLVSNLGFGSGATHTNTITHLAGIPTADLQWPLSHPDQIRRDSDADEYAFRNVFLGRAEKSQHKEPVATSATLSQLVRALCDYYTRK